MLSEKSLTSHGQYEGKPIAISAAVVSLQLPIMGGSLERVRRAYRRADDSVVFGRGHGHACASAQLASR